MHPQGLIGYYAGKSGAGIRIFINRAVASIWKRGAGDSPQWRRGR